MYTVNEIMNLSLFKKFKILTGKEYLTNTVTTTVILEFESSRINYAGYCYGYFVLISYFFASISPELVNGSIKNLIQKRVSGIAIKLLPDEHIPLDIIQCAEEYHVPILTFYDEFMEDLIININESMKTRAQYIIHEEKLNMILNEKKDKDEVSRIAREINPDFKDKIISAVLIPKKESSNLKVHTFFDSLMYHRSKVTSTTPWSFIKSDHNIVLICSFYEDEAKSIFKFRYIQDILMQNGFTTEDFFIGYDEELMSLHDLKKSIKNAYAAAEVAKIKKNDSLSYKFIGVYKYAYNLLLDDIMYSEIKNRINILQDYDKKHDANLIKTLNSFVKNNGDYSATSEDCYQHTNTIRYRIKKIFELLDLDENEGSEEIRLLIRCYHLLKGRPA